MTDYRAGMPNFKRLQLPQTLDTSAADLMADFFRPVLGSSKILIDQFDQRHLSESNPHLDNYFLGTALAHARRYDRGVGFFSSGHARER